MRTMRDGVRGTERAVKEEAEIRSRFDHFQWGAAKERRSTESHFMRLVTANDQNLAFHRIEVHFPQRGPFLRQDKLGLERFCRVSKQTLVGVDETIKRRRVSRNRDAFFMGKNVEKIIYKDVKQDRTL